MVGNKIHTPGFSVEDWENFECKTLSLSLSLVLVIWYITKSSEFTLPFLVFPSYLLTPVPLLRQTSPVRDDSFLLKPPLWVCLTLSLGTSTSSWKLHLRIRRLFSFHSLSNHLNCSLFNSLPVSYSSEIFQFRNPSEPEETLFLEYLPKLLLILIDRM